MIAYYLRRFSRLLTEHIDGPLLGAVLLLMGVGLTVLYSAANAGWGRVGGQMVNMLVALAVMWVVANIPPHFLMRLALPLFILGVVLLLGVAVKGDIVNGARRWLNIGVTRIQPSELMKIAAPLMLAWYFHRYEGTLRTGNFVVGAVMLLVPVILIARQPDLGTAILILSSGSYVLFLAGLSWKIIAGLAVVGAASAPVAWSMLHDYQRQRILTFIDPAEDPLGSGYHTIQSTIAVGSGGITGKGWMSGTQTHHGFHLRGIFRGIRPARQRHPAGPVFAGDRARTDDRLQRADAVYAPLGRCDYVDVFYLRVCQHGHGKRHLAGGGRAAAVDQLRRYLAGVAVSWHGDIDEHTNASQAGAYVRRVLAGCALEIVRPVRSLSRVADKIACRAPRPPLRP